MQLSPTVRAHRRDPGDAVGRALRRGQVRDPSDAVEHAPRSGNMRSFDMRQPTEFVSVRRLDDSRANPTREGS